MEKITPISVSLKQACLLIGLSQSKLRQLTVLICVGPADKKLDTKICCIQAILPAKIAIVYCNFSIFSYSKPCLREMEYRWKHGIQ